jgi:hypothetical protein
MACRCTYKNSCIWPIYVLITCYKLCTDRVLIIYYNHLYLSYRNYGTQSLKLLPPLSFIVSALQEAKDIQIILMVVQSNSLLALNKLRQAPIKTQLALMYRTFFSLSCLGRQNVLGINGLPNVSFI